jgi:hypothetical protein
MALLPIDPPEGSIPVPCWPVGIAATGVGGTLWILTNDYRVLYWDGSAFSELPQLPDGWHEDPLCRRLRLTSGS